MTSRNWRSCSRNDSGKRWKEPGNLAQAGNLGITFVSAT